ncbi:MAG TPA: hypothetical protein VGG20_29505 [Thermoanaerobaculia bacterium]
MKLRPVRLPILAASLAMLALSALPTMSATAPTPEPKFHRVEIKPPKDSALPYNGVLPFTLEVPQDWQVRQVAEFPGLWIGPADAKPPEDPRLIWVRGSKVSLAKPAEIVANIKANDAAHPEWSAPRVETRTVGGASCVLVQMETGAGDKARTSLTLKAPFQTVSVDFIASSSRAEFPKMLPLYERILFSMQPVPAGKK